MSAAEVLQPMEGVAFREATAADVPFILNSWLRSYEATACANGQPRGRYYDAQHLRAVGCLQRGDCLVACVAEEPDTVLGYLVSEKREGRTVVHYVYVKHLFRRVGLATALLRQVAAQGGDYTHHTLAGGALARRLGLHFAPEAIQ